MTKETAEKAINISKNIKGLQNFIIAIKTEHSPIVVVRKNVLNEAYYEMINVSNNLSIEIKKDLVVILENKLQQLEKELEDL